MSERRLAEPGRDAFAVVAAGPEHVDALPALFVACAVPCFCRFWHFEGTNNDWLARSAHQPETSRAELVAALASGSDEARGVIAMAGAEAVGWMKVAPAASVPKLYRQRLYRNLPCFQGDRTGVFTIGCALVHPSWRRRGVARALVEGAIAFAPSWGARSLEAFPRRSSAALRDEELWTGPASTFVACGFVEVNDFAPYPVLRRELSEHERGSQAAPS